MFELVLSGTVSLLLGILVGWLAAIVIKHAAKALGCLLAILFVLLQVLAYYGVVHWNWTEFIEQIRPLDDVAAGAWQDLVKVVTYNISFTVGSLVGFIVSFRRS